VLYVGASGWSYPSWRPAFYPAERKPGEFLGYYASRLNAVELNTTGYRLPAEAQFERWAGQVPDGFRFAVKMPPAGIRMLATVQERARRLGERLGPIRVVVPTERDEGLLELWLGSIDQGLRFAFDFRHPSWEGAEERVEEAGATVVGAPVGRAGFAYLRFREPPYDEPALRAAAANVTPMLDAGTDVYAFFRHEDEPTAPAYAERLRALVGA
jgi:uncharacterized protein YecE (DUF72 family)